MDTIYFDTYNLKWLYDLLMKNKFSCSDLGDGYYSFTDENTLCFINLGEEMHPNVDFRLAIDNAQAYNKIGQVPVSIDILEADEMLVLQWLKFLGSIEGFTYSNSFAYLDDDARPYFDYSKP